MRQTLLRKSGLLPVAAVSLAFGLSACATDSTGSSSAGPKLVGTEWHLDHFQSSDDSIGTIRPKQDEVYTLTLNPDGNITMQLACNRGGGQWTSTDYRKSSGSLELKMGFSSMAACPPGNFDNIAMRLPNVRTFVIQDGLLHLNLMMDAGNYVWRPK
ncbi:MAG: META domain-containing protein [Porphyrobacter sp.]|nr:META domain-containing protein [Porphyrobacter sp.]